MICPPPGSPPHSLRPTTRPTDSAVIAALVAALVGERGEWLMEEPGVAPSNVRHIVTAHDISSDLGHIIRPDTVPAHPYTTPPYPVVQHHSESFLAQATKEALGLEKPEE